MTEPNEFWKMKAEALKKEGKFEEALKAYDKASGFEEVKRKSDTWLKQSVGFLEMGNYEKALECVDNELKFNKASFEPLFEKGVILFYSKKYPEALECFNKAYESTYDEFLDSSSKAQKLKEHKKFEKAVLVSDKAKNVNPIPQKFWHLKGIVLHETKKFDDAVQCFKEALESGDESAEIFYDLARSQLSIGKIDECLDSLEKACKLDSTIRKLIEIDSTFDSLIDKQRFRQIKDYDKIFS